MKIRFGVDLPDYGADYNTIKESAILSEKLEYDTCLVCDHFYPPMSFGVNRARVECLTTLSALAAETERIRLGTFVICNAFREPSVLAKMSSTLDSLSKGRLELGIGACWNKKEHLAYGIPFPKPLVRIKRLREAVRIIKKMWTEPETTFIGEYYRVEGALNYPKPMQKPHPPLLIAGGGERLTLRVVAEFANISCFSGHPNLKPEDVTEKLEILKHHCLKIGRNVNEIECSLATDALVFRHKDGVEAMVRNREKGRDYLKTRIMGTPDECIEKIEEYVKAGVRYFIISFQDINTKRKNSLRLLAEEVIPSFR